jgi:ATP-dependent RNA helicase DHX37/DHR1
MTDSTDSSSSSGKSKKRSKAAAAQGGAVAYHIRYDVSRVGPSTRIKFMTDGILLKELCSDLLLRKYGEYIVQHTLTQTLLFAVHSFL